MASVVTPFVRGFHAGGRVRLDRYRDAGQVRRRHIPWCSGPPRGYTGHVVIGYGPRSPADERGLMPLSPTTSLELNMKITVLCHRSLHFARYAVSVVLAVCVLTAASPAAAESIVGIVSFGLEQGSCAAWGTCAFRWDGG